MLEYLLTLLVTAAVTYLLTPLVRRGAIAARALRRLCSPGVAKLPNLPRKAVCSRSTN